MLEPSVLDFSLFQSTAKMGIGRELVSTFEAPHADRPQTHVLAACQLLYVSRG